MIGSRSTCATCWGSRNLREVHVQGTLEDLGTELAGVPADRPLEADLLLESIVEGILVSGRLRATLSASLRALPEGLRVAARRRGERALRDRARPRRSDQYPLDPEGSLEPEQMVRDTVGVELPFSPPAQARLPRPAPGAAATATSASAPCDRSDMTLDGRAGRGLDGGTCTDLSLRTS